MLIFIAPSVFVSLRTHLRRRIPSIWYAQIFPFRAMPQKPSINKISPLSADEAKWTQLNKIEVNFLL